MSRHVSRVTSSSRQIGFRQQMPGSSRFLRRFLVMTVPVMTIPTESKEKSPRLPDHMLPKSIHSTTKRHVPIHGH